MTQGSSLPPLKKNDSKYVVIALLFLLGAGALWFFAKPEESPPETQVTEPPSETPAREQFVPELEIPEDQSAAKDTAPEEEPSTKSSAWTPPAEWDCRGTLQAAQIRDVINGQPRKQVQTCYEHELKRDNLLQGTMKVLLTIGANGDVRAVSIEGSLGDPQVYACVRRAARTWKFPQPQGGCVRTEVPFQLTPKL